MVFIAGEKCLCQRIWGFGPVFWLCAFKVGPMILGDQVMNIYYDDFIVIFFSKIFKD